VEIIEILLGDLRDGDVVNVDFLPADQIEEKIERAFVDGQLDFVRRRQSSLR
jgi:hypothetical protein